MCYELFPGARSFVSLVPSASVEETAVNKERYKPVGDSIDDATKETEIFSNCSFSRLFSCAHDVIQPPLCWDRNKCDMKPLHNDEDAPNHQTGKTLEAQHSWYVWLYTNLDHERLIFLTQNSNYLKIASGRSVRFCLLRSVFCILKNLKSRYFSFRGQALGLGILITNQKEIYFNFAGERYLDNFSCSWN